MLPDPASLTHLGISDAVGGRSHHQRPLQALTTSDGLKRCRSIGWRDRPSTAADDDMSWVEPHAEDVNASCSILEALTTDMLDLLVWTQAIPLLPKFIGDPPDRTPSASRGSGSRRERIMSKAKRIRPPQSCGDALRAFTKRYERGALDLRASIFGIWGREGRAH